MFIWPSSSSDSSTCSQFSSFFILTQNFVFHFYSFFWNWSAAAGPHSIRTTRPTPTVVESEVNVNVKCYVNVKNHFLTFPKHLTFTRIMLGTPLSDFCTANTAIQIVTIKIQLTSNKVKSDVSSWNPFSSSSSGSASIFSKYVIILSVA